MSSVSEQKERGKPEGHLDQLCCVKNPYGHQLYEIGAWRLTKDSSIKVDI